VLILLAAVDEGLGACFFGMPKERIDVYRQAFGVPSELWPIGAISVGYSDESPRDFSARRRPTEDVVRRGTLGTINVHHPRVGHGVSDETGPITPQSSPTPRRVAG
jgi:hypothetical protein